MEELIKGLIEEPKEEVIEELVIIKRVIGIDEIDGIEIIESMEV